MPGRYSGPLFLGEPTGRSTATHGAINQARDLATFRAKLVVPCRPTGEPSSWAIPARPADWTPAGRRKIDCGWLHRGEGGLSVPLPASEAMGWESVAQRPGRKQGVEACPPGGCYGRCPRRSKDDLLACCRAGRIAGRRFRVPREPWTQSGEICGPPETAFVSRASCAGTPSMLWS